MMNKITLKVYSRFMVPSIEHVLKAPMRSLRNRCGQPKVRSMTHCHRPSLSRDSML